MDYTVHEIIQARILEWVSVAIFIGSSQPRDWTQVSQVSHIACRFFTSWATRETQDYCSGLPIPSAVDLPDPGIQLGSPALQEDSLPAELSGKLYIIWIDLKMFGFIVCVCVCVCVSVCVCVCVCVSHSVVSNSLRLHAWTVTHHLLGPWSSPGKNTGVDCHSLLQGIFPGGEDPGIEPRSPELQADYLPSELPGKPLGFISHKISFFLLNTYWWI